MAAVTLDDTDLAWLNEIRGLIALDKDDKIGDKILRLEALLSRNRFLRELQHDDPMEYRRLLVHAKIIDRKSKNVLTEIGNYAEELLVILSGNVDVFARPAKKDNQGQLVLARTLSAGDGFNEISLLSKQRSLAQYVSNGPAVLLSFDKQDASKITSVLSVQVDMHLQYLKDLPLFWHTNQRNQHLVYMLQSNQRFSKDQSIFLEGEHPNYVYIIKQGDLAFYKYFSDLQQRKSKDSFSIHSIERMSGSSLRLTSFQKNKNIRIKSFSSNEIVGEEDAIGRTTRSISLICESETAEILCFTQAAFKCILMNLDGVSTFVLTRLRTKLEDITRILDEQASQVSSARINILERDITRVAMTKDFVKSRSFFSMTGSTIALANPHKQLTNTGAFTPVTSSPFKNNLNNISSVSIGDMARDYQSLGRGSKLANDRDISTLAMSRVSSEAVVKPLLLSSGATSVQKLPIQKIPTILSDQGEEEQQNEAENKSNSKSTFRTLTPATKRDSQQFFDNFTRNSQQYMQKFQVQQDKQSFGGSMLRRSIIQGRKKNNDDELDAKGKILQQLIQDEIDKSIPASDRAHSMDQQPKIIYKKPLTDKDYSRIKKEQDENQRLKGLSQTPQPRSFRINFYQQKQ